MHTQAISSLMSTSIVHCIRHGKAEVKRIIRYIYTLNKNEIERKTIETLSKMWTLRGDKQQQQREEEKKTTKSLCCLSTAAHLPQFFTNWQKKRTFNAFWRFTGFTVMLCYPFTAFNVEAIRNLPWAQEYMSVSVRIYVFNWNVSI